jgi:hypothetical protein
LFEPEADVAGFENIDAALDDDVVLALLVDNASANQ